MTLVYLYTPLKISGNLCRKSSPKVFCKKVFLKISQNPQENTCARGSGLQPYLKRNWHRCSSLSFVKVLKSSFLYNTSGGCFCLWFSDVFRGYRKRSVAWNRSSLQFYHNYWTPLLRFLLVLKINKTAIYLATLSACLCLGQKQPSRVALQLYWNHISAWVFSSKFAAYFQNTFS